ncbi:MAG: hypothetical protein ACP5F9_08335 [Thiomonas sp.]
MHRQTGRHRHTRTDRRAASPGCGTATPAFRAAGRACPADAALRD